MFDWVIAHLMSPLVALESTTYPCMGFHALPGSVLHGPAESVAHHPLAELPQRGRNAATQWKHEDGSPHQTGAGLFPEDEIMSSKTKPWPGVGAAKLGMNCCAFVNNQAAESPKACVNSKTGWKPPKRLLPPFQKLSLTIAIPKQTHRLAARRCHPGILCTPNERQLEAWAEVDTRLP
jgi:hypothetical protein